ncbi:prolyl oligopeptidase family serine peptidase [Polyangium sp. 6x1]|uniref:prolyl oligopeptidase family serine peptidase n=1 Tax=Polyangium sp. 6x1 TaxID=3042689 RepID=UPI00248244EB|nr:prolyl oligopeptidase family serine peptidase [Polyangium sp. 6x1]MDI1443342.1 prolyl oligopeptidase family serine peptidase [Polyangium sp. 6x1]
MSPARSFAALAPLALLLLACPGTSPVTGPKDKAGPAASASASTEAPDLAIDPPPPTPKKAVFKEYYGESVADDYQWLEDGTSSDVKSWVGDHNRRTRAFLDILPGRQALYTSVRKFVEYGSPAFYALQHKGNVLFSMRSRPPKQQPFLVTLTPVDKPNAEKVLLDPTTIDPSGNTSIDYYVASPDGGKVAVSLSKGDREGGSIRVFDVGSGREIAEVVPQGAGRYKGKSIAWNAGGTGFFYTRYPAEGEGKPEDRGFFQKVYFHKLYTPVKDDAPSIDKLPRLAQIDLETSGDGKFVTARVESGYGGPKEHHVFRQGGGFSKVADAVDEVERTVAGPDGDLYIISKKDAPRGKVLRTSAWKPQLAKATVVVPEGESVLLDVLPTLQRLYVRASAGGPTEMRWFDIKGKPGGVVPILPVSGVHEVVLLQEDDLYFENESFTEASAWYRFRASSGKVEKTAMAQPATADFSDATVVRETCTSKDGTKIPLSILRRKDAKLDGQNPTILTGQGGFGVVVAPDYDPTRRAWLDVGGIVAVANLRGGGEGGDGWHKAGMLTQKQNVFDDFFACAERLFELKVTKNDKLALLGAPQAPLLMGAALTQRPDMFRAVVARGGIYDMLRLEGTTNGAYDVPEYGSTADEKQFKALYGYSPYHRVEDGKPYPATLLLTGENDPRGDPSHARKMAARLLAATSAKAPILLRSSGDTGRGVGTPLDSAVLEAVDVYTFLFHVLGIKKP